MKPAPFALCHPAALSELTALLQGDGEIKLLAGGQSLGPMLNLRVVRPDHLVAVGRLAELRGTAEEPDSVLIGAAVTHGEIEDGLVPEIGGRILPSIATGIAYRAVRNRGTIGGSLSHADPAADWPTCLSALGGEVLTLGPSGSRRIALPDFISGAFRTLLQDGEIVVAVRVPKIAARARWIYRKACRKPGEFAHAMCALLIEPGGRRRLAIGALGGAPILVCDDAVSRAGLEAAMAASDLGIDAVAAQTQLVLARRCLAEAMI